MELIGVIVGISVLALVAILLSIKSLIVICQPSEVVIISGPNKRKDEVVGYRAIRGGRALRIPLLEAVDRIDLTNMAVDVGVRGAYTRDGVPINVQGVANLKIDGSGAGLDNAVVRLLGKSRGEVERLAQQTLEANLRGVLARLTPEEVNQDKKKFAEELIEEAEVDLGRLGMKLDTLKIQTVADEVDYLDSIGRKVNAELIRRARIAEADRKSEAAVQAASNMQQTRVAQVLAETQIAQAEAEKRIIAATTKRPAEVARERSGIEAQIARAEAELKVQTARIEQVRLKLDADLVAPAKAYKAQQQAEAAARVASIREGGKATAAGLRELTRTWIDAGPAAREIFLLEKLRSLVSIMMGTVKNVRIDQITVVGDQREDGTGTTAGKVASLLEQLRTGADIDVAELAKRIGVGVHATAPAAPRRPKAPPLPRD
ncbi:MAG: flotillin family protein [Deltaproteobacteria bacterium]|nr:MAG: flotillin family protein [Deltaproteobacteria bacterium]